MPDASTDIIIVIIIKYVVRHCDDWCAFIILAQIE